MEQADDETREKGTAAHALRAAFPITIPILAGFLLTGMTCGIFAVSLGFPWWASTLMSVVVFAGSAEFVTASLAASGANPLSAFATIFIVNARHLFYGLSMLTRFRGAGRKKAYLIYAMCDETFSINYAAEPPQGVDRGWFMFWVSLLNQSYWVAGCTLGGIFGSMLPLDRVRGISFAMTALFVVIFLDQWLKDKSHAGAVVGLLATAASLALLGAERFMLPALVAMFVLVLALRRRVEPSYRDEMEAGAEPDAKE